MVIDLGLLKAGHPEATQAEIAAVRAAVPAPTVLKVIIESAALADDEIVAACRAAEAAGAWRTCCHGTCFVHHEATAAQRLAVHAFNSGQSFRVAAQFHKAEAFGAAGVTFHHDFGAGNGAVSRESLLQVFVAERIGQVAHVKFVAHERTPQNDSKRDGVQ